jgi:drug/metabolite transporter (DMT)-like permease
MSPDFGTTSPPPRARVVLAFAAIYLVWGSTYVAIRVGVASLPPFLMAGTRFLIAGGLLFASLWVRGMKPPSGVQWRNAAIVGTLLLTGGNGLVSWAEQSVRSSLAALIVGTTPAWFAVMEWVRPGGARPTPSTVLGVLVGFGGVALLVSGRGPDGSERTSSWGVAALMLACVCWAGGSMFARHSRRPESLWMGAAMQMLCGGAGLLMISTLCGEPARAIANPVPIAALTALAYLIVFGSWIGFSAYLWLLKVSTPARVSTYAYVNPVIAVLLGWLILDEPLTGRVLWAAGIIVIGVIIITLPRATQ